MELINIFEGCLFSVKNDSEELNEYQNIFSKLSDKDFLLNFFKENSEYLNNEYWRQFNIEPEYAALSVINDLRSLEQYIEKLCNNTQQHVKPDLDEYFEYFGGKYIYNINYIPMKGYGRNTPTFVRIYAIKVQPNVYIIVYGGLKLGKKIQDSPMLKDNVIKRIDATRNFLHSSGILDENDLEI